MIYDIYGDTFKKLEAVTSSKDSLKQNEKTSRSTF